jgi:hypothetical protein
MGQLELTFTEQGRSKNRGATALSLLELVFHSAEQKVYTPKMNPRPKQLTRE